MLYPIYSLCMSECGHICRARVVQSVFFITQLSTWWSLHLVFQIAAKIGGDAGPPLNNNTASDGFQFTAQKRQLEDAGMVTLIYCGSDWTSSVCRFGQKRLKMLHVNVIHLCIACLMMQKAFGPHRHLTHTHSHSSYVISSPDRWTGEQEAGCTEWLGFSQSTVWVHPAALCSVYLLLCDVNNTHLTVFNIDFQLYSVPVSAALLMSVHASPPLCLAVHQ